MVFDLWFSLRDSENDLMMTRHCHLLGRWRPKMLSKIRLEPTQVSVSSSQIIYMLFAVREVRIGKNCVEFFIKEIKLKSGVRARIHEK